jgi:DNA-directed RNA polymerase subunit RPC12/RpoP
MMDDNYREDVPQGDVSLFRWIVFFVLLALGITLILVVVLTASYEDVLFYTILLVPGVILFLYTAFRWAQGHSVSGDTSRDEEIFEPMRHHALPAEQVAGLEMYRCPDCGMSFELANATPVADRVVLCPICNARLFIG